MYESTHNGRDNVAYLYTWVRDAKNQLTHVRINSQWKG